MVYDSDRTIDEGVGLLIQGVSFLLLLKLLARHFGSSAVDMLRAPSSSMLTFSFYIHGYVMVKMRIYVVENPPHVMLWCSTWVDVDVPPA